MNLRLALSVVTFTKREFTLNLTSKHISVASQSTVKITPPPLKFGKVERVASCKLFLYFDNHLINSYNIPIGNVVGEVVVIDTFDFTLT